MSFTNTIINKTSIRMFFENITEGNLLLDQIDETLNYTYYQNAADLVKFFICFCALVCDIYFIIIMVKFKSLRNRINRLILLYVVFNIMYLTLVNMIVIILDLSLFPITRNWFCIIGNFDHLTMNLSLYALTFLAIDWYASNYHPQIYNRFPRTFKYGIGIAFLAFLIPKWITNSVICLLRNRTLHRVRFILDGVSFLFCGIIIICIAAFRRFRNSAVDIHKTEYAFAIPKIAFSISFPTYVIRVINLFGYKNEMPEKVAVYLYFLEYFVECLSLLMPIILLYVLGKSNKHFKMAYLKCCKKNVQDYNDDDLDSSESPEKIVAFDKTSEVVRF